VRECREPIIRVLGNERDSLGGDLMKKSMLGIARILDALEKHYGVQVAVGPSEPYEMILFVNCGYPATDASCTKGYEPLKAEVGTKPDQILKAPSAKVAKLTRGGGMFPELRAERLKLIARIANENFGGNLKWALERLMKDEKTPVEKRLRRAKGALKEFPVIGEPGADKILLFSGMAPIAAVPSACTGVPQRIFFGHEDKKYGRATGRHRRPSLRKFQRTLKHGRGLTCF